MNWNYVALARQHNDIPVVLKISSDKRIARNFIHKAQELRENVLSTGNSRVFMPCRFTFGKYSSKWFNMGFY